MILDRLTMLVNILTIVYITSFLSYLVTGGHARIEYRIVAIIVTTLYGIYGMGIGSRDGFKLIYNRTYTILVIIIILVMIMTPMKNWAICLVISPSAFYFFRVRNETRDVSLRDFRDLKRIAMRIDSSTTIFYIMYRIVILLVTKALIVLRKINDLYYRQYRSLNYMTLITPILIHDLIMIVLYFQMEYVPETE